MPDYKVWRMTRVSVGESVCIKAETPELALAAARQKRDYLEPFKTEYEETVNFDGWEVHSGDSDGNPLLCDPIDDPATATPEERYLAAMRKPDAASICPCCGDTDPQGYSIDSGGGRASQEMGCYKCGAAWTDLYTLTGVIITQEGEAADA